MKRAAILLFIIAAVNTVLIIFGAIDFVQSFLNKTADLIKIFTFVSSVVVCIAEYVAGCALLVECYKIAKIENAIINLSYAHGYDVTYVIGSLVRVRRNMLVTSENIKLKTTDVGVVKSVEAYKYTVEFTTKSKVITVELDVKELKPCI